MTQLTLNQVTALKEELTTDIDWVINRAQELKPDSSAGMKAVQEYFALRELELVNLALRRYGCHD